MTGHEQKRWKIKVFLGLALPAAGLIAVWSVLGLRFELMDVWLVVLTAATVLFSSFLRIQLPRTKIHLTISDATVFLLMLLYGGEVAVLVSALEAAVASLNFRRHGVPISTQTIAVNVAIATISVFATAIGVTAIFGRPEAAIGGASITMLAAILFAMATLQFVVHSALVSVVIAIKSEESIWRVWYDHCLNAMVIYVAGAIVAGSLLKAIKEIDAYLFIPVAGFFGLVYFTYVRYINDIRRTSAKAEEAERERAEQAERHVRELQEYVTKLERTSDELRTSREEFRHAAFHDDLTGLPNRNHFLAEIGTLLSRQSEGFAVLYLDLNNFKRLNESLGHSIGDELLVQVAERLRALAARTDLVGRFSGDEFAILMRANATLEMTLALANAIGHALSQPFSIGDRTVYAGGAIGIALNDAGYTAAGEILRDADIAMYYAKERRTDCEVFSPTMHARAMHLLELETDLRLAVEREEFDVYFQPIVDMDDATLHGFEALVRWNHPERGLVMPGEFIPLAETTGLVVPMTLQVLRKACSQIVAWQQVFDLAGTLTLSVNISVRHLALPTVVDEIAGVLRETGLPPSCLKLEITEGEVMEDAEAAIAVLNQIRSLDVSISIDDFGTGYSSLSYLHRLPIDTLKIDRSFVSSMEEGSENGEIVRTVIALARALKLSVVAEGIESIHQFHQLRVLGCAFGQGYLFARPLSRDDASKLVCDPGRWQNILPANQHGTIGRNLELTYLRLPN